MGVAESGSAVEAVRFFTPTSADPLFAQAFELGESQSKFLGMLPREAWREYADKQTILVAVSAHDHADDTPLSALGYAAFRLPRNEVALAHLVVDPSARSRGIARQLVEELSRRFNNRRGISAHCRRDYPAHKMWPHLGFVALGERVGRSLQGHRLTYWWKDHGYPDLMSWQGSAASSVLPVVIDVNVFLDLHGIDTSSRATVTRSLFENQLDGRIEPLITPELLNEIDRRRDTVQRERLRRLAAAYPPLSVEPARLAAARQSLRAALDSPPERQRDISDLEHVAYAAAVGIQVVVTQDDIARRRLGQAAREATGIELVSPGQLVSLVDQAEDAPAYWPVSLLGTGYAVREASVTDVAHLMRFLDTSTGEKRGSFHRELERLAGRHPRSHQLLYTDPDGEPIALLGVGMHDGVLEASLLRLRPSALQASLAAQMVARIRELAGEYAAGAIRVTDKRPHPSISAALLADGFGVAAERLVALTSPALCTVSDLASVVERCRGALAADEQSALKPLLQTSRDLATNHSPALIAGLERQMRPIRVIDARLENWLVPIKPHFATELFNAPPQLFDRSPELGISIEHVYYRGGSSGETAPARILWYVSAPVQTVIGCSDLIEVIDDQPDALYKRFRRLGVYNRQQVRAVANGRSTVRALHVINTEVFPRPVPYARLLLLAAATCQPLRLVSASRINQDLFADVMREGRCG